MAKTEKLKIEPKAEEARVPAVEQARAEEEAPAPSPPVERFLTGQPKTEKAPKGESEDDKADRLSRQKQAHQEWASLSAQAKTQIAADLQYPPQPGMTQFRISIPGDAVQPNVVLWAHSEDEAKGRYNRLCGIRTTDHEHSIVPEHATVAA